MDAGEPEVTDGSIDRRAALRRLGLAGMAAGLAMLPGCGGADDGRTVLRWWSPQSSPDQVKAYKKQIAMFEAANPSLRVVFEPTSDEGYPAQFAAAFAAGQVPNIVTHLPSFAAQSYYSRGLLEPMDDVVQAIGPDAYFPGANDVFRAPDGHYCATGIGSTAVDMLWYRRDLLRSAGLDAAPATWDELRSACRRMQRAGLYGAPLPYGMNSMTTLIFIGFVHRAGGQIFTPDLAVAIDDQPTYDALEFFRSMREFCPPGATNFSWGESLTAFVSGATATGIYGGRVLANVAAQNPKIAGEISCTTYPTLSRDIPAWTFNDFPSMLIPKGAPNLAQTKAFAAAWSCAGPRAARASDRRREQGLSQRSVDCEVPCRGRPDDRRGGCRPQSRPGVGSSQTQSSRRRDHRQQRARRAGAARGPQSRERKTGGRRGRPAARGPDEWLRRARSRRVRRPCPGGAP